MNCCQCGAALVENAKYCIVCGVRQTLPETLRIEPEPAGQSGDLTGFSARIADPAYEKWIRNNGRGAAIFTVILALVAFSGFTAAGVMGVGGVSNPQGLLIGLGIGGMFLAIYLIQTLKRKKDKTWEGKVVDKIEKKKRRQRNDGEDTVREEYIEYTITVLGDDGKKRVLRRENSRTLFDYYNVGDRVKHHAGFSLYEKYDKSKDRHIFCIACGNLCNMEDSICGRCKCPLLK